MSGRRAAWASHQARRAGSSAAGSISTRAQPKGSAAWARSAWPAATQTVRLRLSYKGGMLLACMILIWATPSPERVLDSAPP